MENKKLFSLFSSKEDKLKQCQGSEMYPKHRPALRRSHSGKKIEEDQSTSI
jgi:hypothetical protein